MVTNHFKVFNTDNTKMRQVFKDLVNVIKEKAIVAIEAVCLKDDLHKIKVELKFRKQAFENTKYEDKLTMMG